MRFHVIVATLLVALPSFAGAAGAQGQTYTIPGVLHLAPAPTSNRITSMSQCWPISYLNSGRPVANGALKDACATTINQPLPVGWKQRTLSDDVTKYDVPSNATALILTLKM